MSRKLLYSLLGLLVVVVIIFHYPSFTHASMPDTHTTQICVNSLNENGRIKWILNPLSYLGLYAYSAPVGMVYILSGVSQLTGLSVELTVLLASILISVFGTLAAFIMANEFKLGKGFALLTAFIFSIAPFFLSGTTWTASGRNWVVALLPFFVWALLKAFTKSHYKYTFVAILFFFAMVSTHRLAWLTILVLFAFIFTTLLQPFSLKLEIFSAIPKQRKKRLIVALAFLVLFFVAVSTQFLFPGALGTKNIVAEYEKSGVIEGKEIYTILLNIGVNFIGKISIFAPLAAVGVLLILFQNKIDITEKFLLLICLFFLLFVSLRDYMSSIATPFFAILIAFCVMKTVNKLKKRTAQGCVILVVAVVAVSGCYSWVMKDWWREKFYMHTPIPEQTYNTAIYLLYNSDGTFITEIGFKGGMLSAISNKPSLPVGGASLHTYSHLQPLFRNFTLPMHEARINLISLTSISSETDWFYQPEGGVVAYNDWTTIMTKNVDNPDIKNILNTARYNLTHAVFTAGNSTNFLSYTVMIHSEFMKSVRETRYKIYDNGCETIWYINKWC